MPFLVSIGIALAIFFAGTKALAAPTSPDDPERRERFRASLTAEERAWLDRQGTKPVPLGVDRDYKPIEYVDIAGKHAGVTADYVRLIEQITGLRFEARHNDQWTPTLEAAKAGEIAALPCVGVTPAIEPFFYFTKPYLEFPVVLYIRNDVGSITRIEDLVGHTVAVVEGHTTTRRLQAEHPDFKFAMYRSESDALEAVSGGDAEAYIGGLPTTSYLVQIRGLSNIRIAARSTDKIQVHFAVSRKHPELFRVVEKSLGFVTDAEQYSFVGRWMQLTEMLELLDSRERIVRQLDDRLRQQNALTRIMEIVAKGDHFEEIIANSAQQVAQALHNPPRMRVTVSIPPAESSVGTRQTGESQRIAIPVTVGDTSRGFIEVRNFAEAGTSAIRPEERSFVENVARILGEAAAKRDAAAAATRNRTVMAATVALLGAALLGLVGVGALARRNRERALAQEALLSKEQQTHRIVRSMPGAVFQYRLKDSGEGRLEFISPASIELFGLDPETAKANPAEFFARFPAEDLAKVNAAFSDASKTLQPVDLDVRAGVVEASNAAAPLRWIRLSALPVHFDNEGATVFNGICMDIDEMKRIQGELESARARAEAATRAKADFLATMSHEIRTPMNAIINMTALALETELDDKQFRYLDTVSSSARGLLVLINDILDFSKIEAGKLDVENAVFDIETLLDELIDTFRDRVLGRNVEFIVRREPDVGLQWMGDLHRLRQVLLNLLSNAFKFTERGEVLLRISLAPTAAAGEPPRVRFEVRDSGIGIPEDKQKNLFQAFSQADTSTTRRYGGTGLGLAISQRLVQLMGGERIELESVAGKGSIFHFDLPLEPAAPALARSADVVPNTLAKKSVLIVEDNDMTRELLDTIVRGFGLSCSAAANAEEARRRLESGERFDFFLVDHGLPGTSGYTLARLIRSMTNSPVSHAPIILVSAFKREHEIGDIETIRPALFVPKPIKASSLFDAILGLSGIVTPRRRGEVSTSATELKFIDTTVLLAEDNEANIFVATEMLSRFGITLEIARSGREAVDKALALKPSLVFMDVHMPEMDGLDATRELRRLDYKGNIVAMTASALKGDADLCIAAGMNDFVSKPIHRDALEKALLQWIPESKRDPNAPLAPPPQPRGPRSRKLPAIVVKSADEKPSRGPVVVEPAVAESADLPNIPGIDAREAIARLGLPTRTFSAILRRFFPQAATTVAQLRAAVEAGDSQAASMHAHSLAGSGGNIGATALRAHAKALEIAAHDDSIPLQPLLAKVLEEWAKMEAPLARFCVATEGESSTGVRAGEPLHGGAAPHSSEPIHVASVAELIAALRPLAESLSIADTLAIEDQVERVRSLVIPTEYAESLGKILRQIDDYAYDDAAVSLGSILITLEGARP